MSKVKLNKVRRVLRQLILMKDAMIAYRIVRGSGGFVGDIEDVQYLQNKLFTALKMKCG